MRRPDWLARQGAPSLFLRFHNAVLDKISGGEVKPGDFEEAQQTVRWHYQWIVLHDFLKTVLESTNYWLTIHQYPNHHLPKDLCRQ